MCKKFKLIFSDYNDVFLSYRLVKWKWKIHCFMMIQLLFLLPFSPPSQTATKTIKLSSCHNVLPMLTQAPSIPIHCSLQVCNDILQSFCLTLVFSWIQYMHISPWQFTLFMNLKREREKKYWILTVFWNVNH